MKKAKLFTVIMSAVILCTVIILSLCLFPSMTAGAADEHAHGICGRGCKHETPHTDKVFTEWSTSDAMPTAAGTYYLSTDVTIPDTWKNIEGTEIILCLNGHTLKTEMGRVIEVAEGQTLTVCDCRASQGSITGGSITADGAGIYNKGTLYIYGGIITENHTSGNYFGGGIYNKGTAYIFGGSITENSAGFGGGIYNQRGVLTVYDGVISENTAHREGGAVYNYGTLSVLGGELSYNRANRYGGGIRDKRYEAGTSSVMSGGVIKGNTAGIEGGGIYIADTGMLDLSGGVISDNLAGSGGGIYVNGTLNMTGGEVSDNTATTGGGIFVDSDNTLNISGAPVIKDNKNLNGASNLHLNKGATVAFGTLESGVKIGISSQVGYHTSIVGAASVLSFLVPDNDDISIYADGENLKYEHHTYNLNTADDYIIGSGDGINTPIKYKKQCSECQYVDTENPFEVMYDSHPVCGETCTHETKHEDILFMQWHFQSEMPSTEGAYKLMNDVTIPEEWKPSGSTVICLNGYTLRTQSGRVINVESGVTLTVCDCQAEQGKITGGHTTAESGAGVWNKGTFILYGGIITGNNSVRARENRGGSGVLNEGTFLMYGGGVCANNATEADMGVGVSNWNGVFTMYGGIISDNTNEIGKQGGGLYNRGGIFTMYGGEITRNREHQGGGIYQYSGDMYLYGGKIYDNISQDGSGGGAGIMHSGGNIYIGGEVFIYDNYCDNGRVRYQNNIYLKGKPISIIISNEGVLSDISGSKIGLSLDDSWDYSTYTISDNGGEYADCFVSDDSYYEVGASGGKLVFAPHTAHVWETAPKQGDLTNHYYSCVKCTEVREQAHTYVQTVDDTYLKSKADYVNPNIYYEHCKECGKQGDAEFTYGSALSWNGIQGAQFDENGNLIFTLGDGTRIDAGSIYDFAGVDGEKGEKGDVGEVGAQGEKGDKGEKGENGMDGRHAENVKVGLSGGAVAAIAISSIIVAELLAFALIWFVFKKKSFADLVAVFKK